MNTPGKKRAFFNRKIFLFLIFSIIVFTTLASEVDAATAQIRIRTADSATGAVISGASVEFKKGTILLTTKTTDSNGFTPYVALDVGQAHTFIATKTGFQTKSYTWTPPDTTSRSVELAMTPSATTVPVKVRITNANTGANIQGATVTFKQGGVTKGSATTGADGFTTSCVTVSANTAITMDVSATGYNSISVSKGSYAAGTTCLNLGTNSLTPTAGATVPMKVKITDVNTGASIVGATVKFHQGGNVKGTATTGADGFTSCVTVPANVITSIDISASGYNSRTGISISSNAAGTTCLNKGTYSLTPTAPSNITQTCTETDNGQVVGTKGTASNNTLTKTDTCDSPVSVNEAYCSGSSVLSSVLSCGGLVCGDGACVQCHDSDGGQVVGTFGTARDGAGTSIGDGCVDGNTVREGYCDGNRAATISLDCPSGQTCSNGVCQSSNQTQRTRNVIVTVRDSNENPISGANVVFSGPMEFTASTDENGNTVSTALAEGTYTLTVSRDGYTTYSRTWNILTSPNTLRIIVRLNPTTEGCTNECSSERSTRCSGGNIQRCGNNDDDSCLEWSIPTSCDAGKTCPQGGNSCVNCGSEGEVCCVSGRACALGLNCDGRVCVAATERTTRCSSGCLIENYCVPIGYRKAGKYCETGEIVLNQKGGDEACENNFECVSNSCLDSQCTEPGFWRGLIAKLKELFG